MAKPWMPAFALPFVTRSLRGGRGRRYVLVSVLLMLATLVVGLWLAQGRAAFEHELRVEILGIEPTLAQREALEFTKLARSDDELKELAAEADRLRSLSPAERAARRHDPIAYDSVAMLERDGRELVERAAFDESAKLGPREEQLRKRARKLLGPDYRRRYADDFPWSNRSYRIQLEQVLANDGIPKVERYRSPLSRSASVGLIGSIASFVLYALLTLLAPVLVAIQQAQEQYENTLMPLTGTSLSSRELGLGLASGPLSIVAIVALPQALLFLLGALATGHFGIGLAMLVMAIALGLGLGFVAQLLGHMVGRKRNPGMIGVAAIAVLLVAWSIAYNLAGGLEPDARSAGVVPHTGFILLGDEVFLAKQGLSSRPDGDWLLPATAVGSLGLLLLGWLAFTALVRQLEGRAGPLISIGHALLGVLGCVVMVHVALTSDPHYPTRHFMGVALLALPFALLLMGRVPTSDLPGSLRRIPVLRLLAELFAFVAIHVVVTLALDSSVEILHPISLAWLAWCVVVVALLAIRIVATPITLRTTLWVGFCLLTLAIGFAQAAEAAYMFSPRLVFLLSRLNPVLGWMQAALTLWIPISLVRHLRRNLGGLTLRARGETR